jgi:hypothetical protein
MPPTAELAENKATPYGHADKVRANMTLTAPGVGPTGRPRDLGTYPTTVG